MTRTPFAVAVVALLAGSLLAVADPPAIISETEKIARLVADLGNADFTRREAATTELDAIGEPALDELRPACRSANPEVSRRAREVTARIDRRVANEKALAPTLVDLTAEEVGPDWPVRAAERVLPTI